MDIKQLIDQCEFDIVGQCSAQLLETKPEVRDMCAADRCQTYGRSWACPPSCGSIEFYQDEISKRDTCYVVQSFGEIEDSFDFEGMMAVQEKQLNRLLKLNNLVKEVYPDALVLTAGPCILCEKCTCPDEPCRMPEKRLVSMEAAGLVVTEVCQHADIPYYHGPNTTAFTGCVLL